jgi:hypothetical protein
MNCVDLTITSVLALISGIAYSKNKMSAIDSLFFSSHGTGYLIHRDHADI